MDDRKPLYYYCRVPGHGNFEKKKCPICRSPGIPYYPPIQPRDKNTDPTYLDYLVKQNKKSD